MTRYIDADAYIKYCEDKWIPLNVDAVTEQPTADAVEVVRCGECKHKKANGRCNMFADFRIKPSVSDFCSYGERSK